MSELLVSNEKNEKNGEARCKNITRPFGNSLPGNRFRGARTLIMVPITLKDNQKVIVKKGTNQTLRGETPNRLPGTTKLILFRTEPDKIPVPS